MEALKIECPECGPVDRLRFDASLLLERQFEGLYFEVLANPQGGLIVQGEKKDAEYLADFNMKKLTRDARKLIEDDPEDAAQWLYCPKCNESLA